MREKMVDDSSHALTSHAIDLGIDPGLSTYPIQHPYWSYFMKTRQLVAVLLATVTVVAAAPAFASGYGPAPFYKPAVGAPASQRGQNADTIGVQSQTSIDAHEAFGGVEAGSSQSGSRVAVAVRSELYAHH
jgi:hypothetical protein